MRPVPLIALLACLLASTGCRNFKLPVAPEPEKLPLGQDCSLPEQCDTGFCETGRCCQASCKATESCDVKDHEGQCLPTPPGHACLAGGQCPSGVCTSARNAKGEPVSYCCDRACALHERCDLPGLEGHCTPRPLGAPCDRGTHCPTGFCVEGVCCDAACQGDCSSCLLSGTVGTCSPVADNTDPRDRCGQCGACHAGWCSAAESGTDPKEDCRGTEVCSPSQTCGLPGGAPCAGEEECAVGECVLGRCFSVTRERAFPDPMDAAPTRLRFAGLSVGDAGEVALAVGAENSYSEGGTTYIESQDFYTRFRTASGWVTAQNAPLDYDGNYGADFLGALAFWTGRLYQLQFQPCSNVATCGLGGQLFSASLETGKREQLQDPVVDLTAVDLLVDGSQRLWAAYTESAGSSSTLRVRRREAQPGEAPVWTDTFSGPVEEWLWGVAAVGSTVYLATFGPTAPSLSLVDVSTNTSAGQLVLPSSCSPYSLQTATFGRGEGQGLMFSVLCRNELYLVTWTPSAPEAERWSSQVQPDSVLGAIPVRNAEVPAFAALTESAGLWTAVDVALTWRAAAAPGWTSVPAFASKASLAVSSVRAVAGPDGAPVVAVSTNVPVLGELGYPTAVQVLRFHK